MEDLIKKVSYLKGYADGLDLSPKSDEGKLIIKLLDVMSEMADTIEELNARVDDVEDVVDELDDCVFVHCCNNYCVSHPTFPLCPTYHTDTLIRNPASAASDRLSRPRRLPQPRGTQ